jgi:hypothetical protein
MGKFIASVEDHLILPALLRLPEGDERSRRHVGDAIPAPTPVRLLLDTGASRTTVVPGVIQHLTPLIAGRARVITPLEAGNVELFWVRMDFPETRLASLDAVAVARLAMPARLSHVHGLFGRDLLRRLESLLYEGRRGRYTLRDTPGLFGWLRRRL